ncbi:MAG: glycosyl hydrolase family 95 catalytic domain-containing protein [Balneolaceae bacterium]
MRKTVFLIVSLLLLPFVAHAQDSGWVLEADDIDPNNYFGITSANGMVGIVSSAEPLKVSDTVLNGVYDFYGRGRVSNILRGFNFAGMNLDVNGERINRNNISDMHQRLHMRNSTIETTFTHNGLVDVTHTVRALRHLPFTSMIDLEVTALQDVTIRPASVIEAPDHLRDVRNYYSVIDRPHVQIPLMTSVADSPTGKHTVAVSNSFIFSEETMPRYIHEDWDHNMHLAHLTVELKAGESYRFTVVSSATSTEHFADPQSEAERLSVFAMLEGRDRLIMRHNNEWDKLWESDIIIEGNEQDQLDVRTALYHLYAFVREGSRLSLSPMGLSGLGYNGHVFWDTEIWMYPPLLIMKPELARSLIDYRFDRLEGARNKAFSHGFGGVMFPWESSDTGDEATPFWALTGPFQHHITAVVGIAFWNYYQVTQDLDWLREEGFTVLKETAAFWLSRVEENSDGGFDIINVVAADEHAENVDNNAFTNGTAIKLLRSAAKAARQLGEEPDPMWEYVADRIPILEFEDGTVQEHATYMGEMIKQADVNLLSYPLGLVDDPEQMRKNLAYYEQRVDPRGPAMTHSVYSTINSRLGNAEDAYRLFRQGYQPNKLPPFGVIAETAGGTNPYFITGAGGFLQAVISGFAGVEITDEGLVQLDTPLPRGWRSLTIKGAGVDRVTYVNSR